MLAPTEFVDVARLLADPTAAAPPPDAQLRRAVSTAYYAVFHTALTTAAGRFMGTGATMSAGYALLYRGFNHGQMRRLCEDVDKSTLSPRLQQQLGRLAVHPQLRIFATNFVGLQQLRHMADYDPHVQLFHADAVDAVSAAEQAIEALRLAPDDERTDLLALLLASARA
jgi:hypothetical protein